MGIVFLIKSKSSQTDITNPVERTKTKYCIFLFFYVKAKKRPSSFLTLI